ncbi:MAG: hypothetical protein VW125_06260, partial [Flavobacteriaceae bacterium]
LKTIETIFRLDLNLSTGLTAIYFLEECMAEAFNSSIFVQTLTMISNEQYKDLMERLGALRRYL